MAQHREQLAKRAAARGKYSPLYRRLAGTEGPNWRVSFSEIETILGFTLPDSARLHRPWWANQSRGGGHSHSLAWQAAGWRTSEVDLDAETLIFQRIQTETDHPVAGGRKNIAREAAANGKYALLYKSLSTRPGSRWRTTFSEIEAVLGFKLPPSARHHRPWWANQRHGGGLGHSLAWQAAGWQTAQVDLAAETLVFEREEGVGPPTGQAKSTRPFVLARDFPAMDMGPWPEDFAVRREEIYDDRE
ncbi:MAG: hypothetical protein OXI95_01435 [bacterium]|nr:hypothetical protein [bacterium]